MTLRVYPCSKTVYSNHPVAHTVVSRSTASPSACTQPAESGVTCSTTLGRCCSCGSCRRCLYTVLYVPGAVFLVALKARIGLNFLVLARPSHHSSCFLSRLKACLCSVYSTCVEARHVQYKYSACVEACHCSRLHILDDESVRSTHPSPRRLTGSPCRISNRV